MKQLVKYIDLGFCVVGCQALVMPLNHPSELVENRVWATTTEVLSLDWTPYGPRFETLNTIYEPIGDYDAEEIRQRAMEKA